MDSDLHAAIRYHDKLAAHWDGYYQRGGTRRRAEFIKQTILSSIPVGGHWLDVGCGTGFFSRLLVDRGAKVLGVDGSQTMIEFARQVAIAEGLRDGLEFKKIDDIEALDLDDATFDGCICFSVIEYLINPDKTLLELRRILKPGGILIISVPNKYALVRACQKVVRWGAAKCGHSIYDYLAVSRTTFNRVTVEALLSEVGFGAVDITSFEPVLPRIVHGVIPGSLLFVRAKRKSVL